MIVDNVLAVRKGLTGSKTVPGTTLTPPLGELGNPLAEATAVHEVTAAVIRVPPICEDGAVGSSA